MKHITLISLILSIGLIALAQAPVEKHRGAAQDFPQIIVKSEPLVIPDSIVWKALSGLFAAFSGLAFYIWKKREKDIEGITARLATKVDIDGYQLNREEMMNADEKLRVGIIACHEKMEDIDKRAQSRHETGLRTMQEILIALNKR